MATCKDNLHVREKLVELLIPVLHDYSRAAACMEYLIANGVTVQEWIPVSEPPSVGEKVNVAIYDSSGDTPFSYSYVGWYTGIENKWVVDDNFNTFVTHWMPLPTPPKGEENE